MRIKKIYFRSHPHSTSPHYQDNSLRDEDVFPEYIKKFLNFDNRRSIKAEKLMSRSRIIIINYFSTAWIQALVSNKPTIILWNKNSYELMHEYSNFFDKLIEAQIIHTDSKQAAKFLMSVFDKPDIWWNKKETIEARNNFLSNNFMVDQNLEQILLNYSNQ